MTALDELVDPSPGAAALSTTITDRPFLANSYATEEPITPAPITIASHLLFMSQQLPRDLEFNVRNFYCFKSY